VSDGARERAILAEAYGLGFDLAGIARLGPAETSAEFDAWIAAGHHGTMAYLERGAELRHDTTRPEPGMRSAIVVGMNYGGTQPSGPIARYARGDDYHRVMWDRLEGLADALRVSLLPGLRARAYVDTGPILERDLARRAGLGWSGKNTMLINPKIGSFFFIGSLFVDAELEPTARFDADRCGTCTRCLDACPTQAFVAPRVMDARQCISYLTIEHRGEFTPEQSEMLGDHLYGCDICQDVCPWNVAFARDGREPAFAARPFMPTAREVLALDASGWALVLGRSAMSRAKRLGLIRNALAVVGAPDNDSSVEIIRPLLDDEDERVRHSARVALTRIGTESALATMLRSRSPNA
jgi:epoxyqueuosine reductase